MLTKILSFNREQGLIEPGDRVVCAVSGGADSVALLFALYLLKDRLKISLSAAHFNHGLRGEESDRDARFVEEFCRGYDIPCYMGGEKVVPGAKGLEAAAREARYRFFATLPGKIATAHTADDNTETVLMHLVRGTGLRGLGGIHPKRENLIRPMLTVTRKQVLAFLQEYHLQWVEDSSNATEQFLRNRLRHQVMPLLCRENPQLAENVSAMALRLGEDAKLLDEMVEKTDRVSVLRAMPQPLRNRSLAAFLESNGVIEPEAAHIAQAESLILSDNPSARARFPGGICVGREYDTLKVISESPSWKPVKLNPDGVTEIAHLGVEIHCHPAEESCLNYDRFTVLPQGNLVVRPRQSGDTMRLRGGTKTLKKLFSDRKIPAAQRPLIPVIADDAGVLGVAGIGANLDRVGTHGITIQILPIKR